MADANMREVVARLRSENCRASLELREFQYAVNDVVQNVERLVSASDEMHAVLRHIGAPSNERTNRLSARATQVVLAFRAVRVAVLDWNVAGSTQSARHRTAMRDVVERLHSEGSDAILELRAIEASFDQTLQSLGLLAVAAGQLHVAAQNIGAPDTIEGYRRLRVARERAEQLSTRAAQVLLEVRSLRAELAHWNIMGADVGSHQPNGSAPGERSRE